jgi:hypothetical protein
LTIARQSQYYFSQQGRKSGSALSAPRNVALTGILPQ